MLRLIDSVPINLSFDARTCAMRKRNDVRLAISFGDLMGETLDALKLVVVLANEDSRILHANRAAQEMMRNGGPLRERCGVLRAEGGAASIEIGSAIKHAARNESGIGKTGLAVRLTEEDEALVVAHVLPLAGGKVRTCPEAATVAAVFINPKVEDAANARALATTFGLTPAETRVLTRILTGSTVAEAAADLGVAPTTTRTHLYSIFAKTGVSRQSELIRLAAQIASVAHWLPADMPDGGSAPSRVTSQRLRLQLAPVSNARPRHCRTSPPSTSLSGLRV